MAKLYSKSRGKAGSHKPLDKTVPIWVTYKPAEVEQLIVKLVKQEKGSSLIGIILRDSYGIPSVKALLGKSIMEVIKEKKLGKKIPEDLIFLIKKNIAEMKHMESNKHDMVAHRGIQLTESKIKRLAKYYKARKVLPENWAYNRIQAKLYLE
ncbi:MAG: 30S ribosomal protein S15 [bacterium]|nr:30S ribosomal protein S15 [bacterium]